METLLRQAMLNNFGYSLKGKHPTPFVMPKTNLGAAPHLKSSKTRKLLPTLPNEFQSPTPFNPLAPLEHYSPPVTTMFKVH
jgi:hypothetical protein